MMTSVPTVYRPARRSAVARRPRRWQAFSCILALAAAGGAGAQTNDIVTDTQTCLQQQVIKPAHRSLSVSDLYALCEPQTSVATGQPDTSNTADNTITGTDSSSDNSSESSTSIGPETELNRFFRPYKDNYIVFGRARTADGTPPFSGERLDTKFELGLTFNLFQEITNLTFLAPLAFGYSQRSWWDISEDSQPFAEHNYNPEVFWRFNQPSRPLTGRFPYIDIVGIEHQSNGLQGAGSRSWDRAYIQKEFNLHPRLSVNVKLWSVLGDEATNQDITDFLGYSETTFRLRPNDRTQIRLKLLKGNAVEKYSYQLDISYRRPWVNSAFFISYYEGYGEALISYNQKTRSLRAGLYFPLEVLSR